MKPSVPWIVLLLNVALLPGAGALADPVRADVEQDAYVILYKKRLVISRALYRFRKAKHDRVVSLQKSGASSREEVEEAAAEMDVAGARIGESEALLDICRARRENGLDMPIFPANQ